MSNGNGKKIVIGVVSVVAVAGAVIGAVIGAVLWHKSKNGDNGK